MHLGHSIKSVVGWGTRILHQRRTSRHLIYYIIAVAGNPTGSNLFIHIYGKSATENGAAFSMAGLI
jgi:hypothetical protein